MDSNLDWFVVETRVRKLISGLVTPVVDRIESDKEEFNELKEAVTKAIDKLELISNLGKKYYFWFISITLIANLWKRYKLVIIIDLLTNLIISNLFHSTDIFKTNKYY